MKQTAKKILVFLVMLVSPRTYTIANGKVWVKEFGSPPEELNEHLQKKHDITPEDMAAKTVEQHSKESNGTDTNKKG